MATWNFAGGKGITPRGMNNGEIDTFKSAPIRSLAREICQNSLDALPPEEKKKRAKGECVPPVVVRFTSFDGSVPDRQKLLESVNQMRDYWKGAFAITNQIIAAVNRISSGKATATPLRFETEKGYCEMIFYWRPDNAKKERELIVRGFVGASKKNGDWVLPPHQGRFDRSALCSVCQK